MLALLDIALKVTVMFAAAGLVCAALRRKSAAIRHAIWTAALCGALLLPLLTLVVPAWRMALPETATALFRVDASAAPASAMVHRPAGAVAWHSPAIPWANLALLLWAAGAGLVLARAAAGMWFLRRLVSRGRRRLPGWCWFRVLPCP